MSKKKNEELDPLLPKTIKLPSSFNFTQKYPSLTGYLESCYKAVSTPFFCQEGQEGEGGKEG